MFLIIFTIFYENKIFFYFQNIFHRILGKNFRKPYDKPKSLGKRWNSGGAWGPGGARRRATRSPPEGQTPGGQKEPAGGPEGARRRAKPRARGPGPGPSEARPGAGARGRGPGPGARGSEPGPGAEGQGSGRARWSKAWPTLARLRELGEPGPRNPARARVGAQTTGAC